MLKELRMKTARIITVATLIVASGLALRVAQSQQTGIKRTELQRHDLSIPGREVIQVRGDFPVGAAVPREPIRAKSSSMSWKAYWSFSSKASRR
jgi:hypothetical protein